MPLQNDVRYGMQCGGMGEQVVPPKAWDALQSWYEGGPFLERRVINYHGSLELELFPLSLKVRRRRPAAAINLSLGMGGGERRGEKTAEDKTRGID